MLECSLGAGGSVEVHTHFDNAVLSRPEVSRLVRQFEHVLHQLAEPAGTITELEMISPRDKEDLLQWNATMPDMVIDWAVLTPSFVNTVDPTTVPTLKTLCLAGEAMTA